SVRLANYVVSLRIPPMTTMLKRSTAALQSIANGLLGPMDMTHRCSGRGIERLGNILVRQLVHHAKQQANPGDVTYLLQSPQHLVVEVHLAVAQLAAVKRQ